MTRPRPQGRAAPAARAALQRAALATCPAFAGCSTLTAQGGNGVALAFVAFAGLALLVAAFAAHAWGRLSAQRDGARALREARAELRLRDELDDEVPWRCGAQQQALAWRGARGLTGPLPALFEPPQAAALERALCAQARFDALELRARDPAALGGSRWRLRGVPRFDDEGHFVGHVGRAQCLDAVLPQAGWPQGDATLQAVLDGAPAAAAVALDHGTGWALHAVNAAATQGWDAARAGRALADWTAALPPAVAGALQSLPEGGGTEAGGWWLQRFAAAPGVAGLLLQQRAAGGPASDAAPARESEQFSLTLSHDLRAPIRVVEGFTRIVKEDYGALLDRVGNDHLDRVLGAAARMNQMIDALLTLSRLSTQPLARQPVNLSQLAGWIVDDLRRAAPEREAEVDIEPGLTVQGDPTLLRLVLENLLGNAWKYTARCEKARITLHTSQDGARRVFEVRDNGAGFDMRSAERLFGLFQRLHSANDFPGHGVGLASVKRIVQRHGGDIWAEAEPGRGAAFRFTLAD